ncbi:MAG: molybdenum cofactor sulfurase [Devosiaceae bacterium]|nr:molybdenum cofactor sulfurase [Devosiaceae bacterium]
MDANDLNIIPAQKRIGRVEGIYSALGKGFETQAVEALTLTFEGIPGDRHSGLARLSNSREPWYKKGTQMRNEQQLSMLSGEEMGAVAQDLKIERLEPEWIGGNILFSGIANFSQLPPRTLLMFEGGVTVRVDGDRGPCKIAGRALADQFENREDLVFAFPKTAKYRRGLVGWVEVPGVIKPGEIVTARIWEQCIYPG